MIYRPLAGGSRFRGVAAESVYDEWPAQAKDPNGGRVVHWGTPPGETDPFLAGAYGALSWALELVFGDFLGQLLNEATISNVERWNGSQWVPLA